MGGWGVLVWVGACVGGAGVFLAVVAHAIERTGYWLRQVEAEELRKQRAHQEVTTVNAQTVGQAA